LVQQVINNEDGYTVVEILVALTLLAIITAVVGSVFIFTARQMNNWRDTVNTTNELHITTERLYHDILVSNDIMFTDSLLMLSLPTKGQITYSGIDYSLQRNAVQLFDAADSLLVTGYYSADNVRQLELRYVVGNKVQLIPIIVANRQPKLWEDIQRD